MMDLHVRRDDDEDDSSLQTSEHHRFGENFFVPSSDEVKENQFGEKLFIINPPSKISNHSLRRASSLSSARSSGSGSDLSVSFGRVSVRRYARALGDHPDCSVGPALTLSWEFSDEESTKDLNEYEQESLDKLFTTYPRKSRTGKLRPTNPFWRKNTLLVYCGVEEEELKDAEKERSRIQRERSVTRLFSGLWRVEFALGSAKRKLKRCLSNSKC